MKGLLLHFLSSNLKINIAMSEIEKELKEILEKSRFGLTETDFNNANEFIKHGEYGVALELICDQLYENEAVINDALLNSIRGLANSMRLDNSCWDFLNESLG